MRDIRFRAWDEENNKMLFNVGVLDGIAHYWCEDIGAYTTDDDVVLMQFVELKDKNGVSIYEGDVLETDTGLYYVSQALPFIKLVDKNDEDYKNDGFYESSDIQHHEWDTFKVIGNIYENPELLEEQNQ